MKESKLESFTSKNEESEEKEVESKTGFREFIKNNSKKIARSLLFVTFLAVGDKIAQPLSAEENVKDQSKEQAQEQNSVFKDISDKFQTFDIKNTKEIKDQLNLYEKNKEILESLTGLNRAEYLHQLSFVQTAALINELSFGDIDHISYDQDRIARDPENIKQAIGELKGIYFNILEAATLRDISRDDYKNRERTLNLKNETFDILINLSAALPEAIKSKKEAVQIIQNEYGRGKTITIEENTKLSSPYYSLQINLFDGDKKTTFPIDLRYNPLNGGILVSGFLVFSDSEEAKAMKEIKQLVEQRIINLNEATLK